MKTITLSLSILAFMASCTAEENGAEHQPAFRNLYSKTDQHPSNPSNPYDSTGAVYLELLHLYYERETNAENLDALLSAIESTALDYPGFIPFYSDYTSPDLLTISSIINDPERTMENLVANSGLSLKARLSWYDFTDTILSYMEENLDYSILHQYITAYETEWGLDFTYTATDKQLLLVSSSIIRHSVYAKNKKPKKNTDPEWDLMIGNFTAAMEGAKHSKGTAIIYALVTGIAENDF